jgi:RNA recognition motif-containing protein
MKKKKTYTKSDKPVKAAKVTEENKDLHTVYISNLSYQLDRNNLKNIFSNFGEVKQVKLVLDSETQTSKGMAFVRMGSPAEVKEAIKGLNQQIIDGRTVKVSHAIPMKKATTAHYGKLDSNKEEASSKKEKDEKPAKKGPVRLKDFLAQKARTSKA